MTVKTESTKWIGSAGWAVADQATYVCSTALLNIFLARWLSAADYGAFAVAYSVFLFFGAFHVALLIEPMLVFGSGRYAGQFSGYLRMLVRGSHLVALAGSLLLMIAGLAFWLLGSPALGQAVLGVAVATPCTLFMWLVKRAAYVRQRPRMAATQSCIYFVLLLSGMILLKSVQAVSVFSTMLVMAFAGACSALWLMKRLRFMVSDVQVQPDRESVLTTHWEYGRWAVLTGILAWVPLNFFFVALSTSIGLEASGNLKALTNLVLPLLQANAALSLVLVPLLITHTSEKEKFTRLVSRALLCFAAVGVPYALVIGIFGSSLTSALYGGRYHATARVMWLLALIPLLDGAQVVLGSALRSLRQPKQIFRAQLFAAASLLAIGTVAAGLFGVPGAAAAIVLASVLAIGMLALSLFKYLSTLTTSVRPVEGLNRTMGRKCAEPAQSISQVRTA
jgi:O-antigen/teichoic acid export membrane protein